MHLGKQSNVLFNLDKYLSWTQNNSYLFVCGGTFKDGK